MKKFIFAVTLMVVSVAAHSQLFDGFIDGGGLGNVDEIVSCYKQKGYEIVEKEKTTNLPVVFMVGKLKPSNVNVLIYIKKKDSDESEIDSITMYLLPTFRHLYREYLNHKRAFVNIFGKPSKSSKNSSYWIGENNIVYTIGIENDYIFHSLKHLNK